MGKRRIAQGAAAAELRFGLFDAPERPTSAPLPAVTSETVSESPPATAAPTARQAWWAFESHCQRCTTCRLFGETRCPVGAVLWATWLGVHVLFECQCGATFQRAAEWQAHRCW